MSSVPEVNRFDLGVLDTPLSMAVVRYLYDHGGAADLTMVRGHVRSLLRALGWERSAIDDEFTVQLRRMRAIGYVRWQDRDRDSLVLTTKGRNGALYGTPRRAYSAQDAP